MTKQHLKKSILITGAAVTVLFGGILLIDRNREWTDWVAGIMLGSWLLIAIILWVTQPKRGN